MHIECSTEFVKLVRKRTKKHFALTWTYLIVGGACLYKALQHANMTGRCGVFKDILIDEYKVEDKNATEE